MAEDGYSELKRLLLADEQDILDELHHRVTDKAERAGDMAESLPDAIRMRTAQDDLLTETLEEPVAECVNRMIRDKPALFVDAVSPVIGPAIRRSIYEALSSLTDTINRTLEQSLSTKGIGWRIEAMRTGVPFAEVVLKHTLIYRVEQIFLIHRDSGLLIQHVAGADIEAGDSDAVSGMLTAIQDFVRESFTKDGSDELNTVDMGDHTLWLLRSRSVLMACVIRGIPPRELKQQLQSTLDMVQDRYSDSLESFNGDSSALHGLEENLKPALAEQTKQITPQEEEKIRRARRIKAAAIGLPLAALLSWWLVTSVIHALRVSTLRENLSNRQGIVITDIQSSYRKVRIEGLVDPIIGLPWDAIDGAEFEREQVTVDFNSYQSLDPDIVLLRARKQLRIPAGIQLSLRDGILKLNGKASSDWVSDLESTWIYPPGIDGVDTSGLNPTQRRASPPPPRPKVVRMSAEARQLINVLEGLSISFAQGTELSPGADRALASSARILTRLARLAEKPGHQAIRITIMGDSDGTGDAQRNQTIRQARAKYVRNALIEQRSVPASFLLARPSDESSDDYDPDRRRVYFRYFRP